jgi:hypothetical protein
MDQWNRTKVPGKKNETVAICFFTEEPKTCIGRKKSFQQMVLGKLDIHM